ncbi:MAG: sugar phosphate isomerase/epimerase [Chitinophagaceae bacterium]
MKVILYLTILCLLSKKGISQNSSVGNWQLSVQTWTFHKFSLVETINKADTLGIKYLEVYPGQKVGADIPGVFSYSLVTIDRQKIKDILQIKGIKIIAFGVIDRHYYKKDNLEKFFEFAKYMDIPFITAEPEWKDLDEFNRLAKKYKVKVALHCHPKPTSHYWHPDSTLKAMQGRKKIGAWPDIGHWARNGVNIQSGLKKLESKIWGMHFKDVKEFDNVKTEDTLFGKGVCNLPAVLKELKRLKFKGVISMEYEANEDNNMEDMKKNMDFYRSTILKL